MAMRKGMGKGRGKGFKNMMGQDPVTHSNNAKGIKQRQNIEGLVAQAQKKGNNQENFLGSNKKQEFFTDVDDITREEKTPQRNVLDKKGNVTKIREFAGKKLQERREQQKKNQIKKLETIKSPLVRKLDSQQKRVDQIQREISQTTDANEESKLFDELNTEEEQLRELQEQATNIDVRALSDRELKTLAIRRDEESVFLTPSNPYQNELVRRVKSERRLNQELKKARTEPLDDESLFGGERPTLNL